MAKKTAFAKSCKRRFFLCFEVHYPTEIRRIDENRIGK